MSQEIVTAAMERFGIPDGQERFLFTLPAFYVAKADGSVSMKEAMSIIFNAMKQGLVREAEHQAFGEFAKSQVVRFMSESGAADLDLVTRAVAARLTEYPAAEAGMIRGMIRQMCEKVAASSGPLFRDKVSAEERRMLDRIFSDIDEPGVVI